MPRHFDDCPVLCDGGEAGVRFRLGHHEDQAADTGVISVWYSYADILTHRDLASLGLLVYSLHDRLRQWLDPFAVFPTWRLVRDSFVLGVDHCSCDDEPSDSAPGS